MGTLDETKKAGVINASLLTATSRAWIAATSVEFEGQAVPEKGSPYKAVITVVNASREPVVANDIEKGVIAGLAKDIVSLDDNTISQIENFTSACKDNKYDSIKGYTPIYPQFDGEVSLPAKMHYISGPDKTSGFARFY